MRLCCDRVWHHYITTGVHRSMSHSDVFVTVYIYQERIFMVDLPDPLVYDLQDSLKSLNLGSTPLNLGHYCGALHAEGEDQASSANYILTHTLLDSHSVG